MKTRVNDCDLFYSRSGSGPAIVLIHGFPLDRTIWSPQVEELSKHFQVIAPDLRGHGQSQATDGVYTMDLLASDVNQLLDKLGIRAIVLGGFSMGGYVAQAFVRLYGSRIHGLILADTKAEADSAEAKTRREQQAQDVLENGPAKLADQMIQKMFTKQTLESNKDLVRRVRTMMEGTSRQGVAGALRGMAQRIDSMPILAGIKVPTLIIVGKEDTLTTVADAQKMAENIPNSQLVVIPDAAHLTTLERPEEVNSAFKRFLERIPK